MKLNNIKSFKNKTLLITGGTGSFGKAVLNKFINLNIKQIIVFSRDEKQEELRLKLNNKKIKFVIGDVREYSSIHQAMNNVDYVFHAAALKQVPSCDFYPYEAVKTNIIGTENTLNAAIENNVKKFLLLSTDKAVYPINAMGISKAMAERIVQAKSRNLSPKETTLCITRYGNVIASRASVIPRFLELAKKNNPLPVTDEKMTRFMMSLEESVNLVLYALVNGSQGDIFVQKSPSCKIVDLAYAIGKYLNKKIKIKIIGSRHGEKLNETLISREEMLKAKDLGKYYKITTDNRSLNYALYEKVGNYKSIKLIDFNSDNTKRLNSNDIVILLKKLKLNENLIIY